MYSIDVFGLVLEIDHGDDTRIGDLLLLLDGKQVVDGCVGVVEFVPGEGFPEYEERVACFLILFLAIRDQRVVVALPEKREDCSLSDFGLLLSIPGHDGFSKFKMILI